MSEEKLFTTGEAAKKLKISRQWFYKLTKKYKLKPVKQYGKSRLYTAEQLNELQ